MSTSQFNMSQIIFETNNKMELIKKIMLFSYVVLETLYKTVFGKYLADEMERVQCVAGAILACLLLIEWIRLDKDNKIKWLKKHVIVFIYFGVRIITFINVGFAYTMLRSVFFEGIYLLVLAELVLDSQFCNKVLFKFFIAANLILNIINTLIYMYCSYIESVNTMTTDTLYALIKTYTFVGSEYGYHYSSMYSNPNQIGLMTGLAILIAVHFLSKNMARKNKIMMSIYFIFSIYCMIYSNCSSSHVAMLAVAVAFIGVRKIKKLDGKKIIVICLACCILATSGVYIIAATNNEFGPYSEFEETFNNLSSARYAIWKDSYYSHKEEVLLGCGNITLEKRDRYQYNLDKGWDFGLDVNSSLIDFFGPHNGYIGMLSCTGALGFIAFIALLLRKIYASRSLNKGYWYLAIVFILVINLFECMVPVSKNFVTLYMFLIITMDDREALA